MVKQHKIKRKAINWEKLFATSVRDKDQYAKYIKNCCKL